MTMADLFGPGIGVAEVSLASIPEPLWPGEAAAVARAVPARRSEFALGRMAARRAMMALGLEPCPVPSGPDRAPVWPTGLVGGLSHGAGTCIAAVARSEDCDSIGVDLEPDEALDRELWTDIFLPEERDWLATLPAPIVGRTARLFFSAKECAYKWQYPLTGALFGFETLRIFVADGGFRARFERDVGRFRAGDILPGRYRIAEGRIMTVCRESAVRS